MGRYFLQRLASGVGVMAALVVLVFFAAYVIGDPVSLQANSEWYTEADIEAMRASFGYSRPMHEQFLDFIGGAVRGDLGVSVTHHRAATAVLFDHLPATALLAGTAVILTVLAALPMALISARRPGTLVDGMINGLATALASLPSFWFALGLVFVFALRIDWLPTGGYGARELILPSIALAALPIGHLTLVLSAALRSEFTQQYVIVARARGLSEWRLALRHVLQNASLVMATQLGFLVVALLNGAVLIEVVFAWPGLGQLGLSAVQQRDLPLVTATVIYIGLIVTGVNLLLDLLYARLDPRVRIS